MSNADIDNNQMHQSTQHLFNKFLYCRTLIWDFVWKKKKIIALYIVTSIACAVLLAQLFGNNFDGSKIKYRGEMRKKRQVNNAQAAASPGQKVDPFSLRPKISSRNGHLIIEPSQDKNIEFRTSGSRGAVTFQGHKLDQLLGVVRALESSAAVRLLNETARNTNGTNPFAQFAMPRYELLLSSLFDSADRLASMDKINAKLGMQISQLSDQLSKLAKGAWKRKRKLNKLAKQIEQMEKRLMKNDCQDERTFQSVCRNGATCIDMYESFKCLCPTGWTGARCDEDIDECATLRNTDLGCQNGARCVNLPGSYRCECPAQFHGIHCTERHDDCSLAPEGSLCGHGKCVNLARIEPGRANYECVCDQGWTQSPGSNSPACIVDVDECAAGRLIAPEMYPGQVPALSPNASSNAAQPLEPYPCSQNPFVECINLAGSFQCAPCPAGYSGNGRVCRDIDECRDGQNGGCSQVPLVECINIPGGRRCGPCPAGYTGDGQQCRRVPACQAAPNGGCHPTAKCIELAGAESQSSERICVCQFPFTGPGFGADGCTLDVAALANAAGGSPSALGWTGGTDMSQISGWPGVSTNISTRPQQQQQQQQQDDCHPNPCLNGATCRTIDSVTFECSCPAGFTGKLCDQRAELLCGGQLPASSGVLMFPPSSDPAQQDSDSVPKAHSSTGSIQSWYKRVLASVALASQRTDTPPGSTRRKQMHKCTWSVKASPANLSLKLDFFNMADKRRQQTTNNRVQLLLTNETTAHSRQYNSLAAAAATHEESFCEQAEHLDVLEIQADTSGQRRLVARFCASQSSSDNRRHIFGKNVGKLASIMVESDRAELEYTFPLVPLGAVDEPALTFELNWQTVEPACGGELAIATSGSVSSPKFPEFYTPGIECRWFIRVPPSNRIRLQFGELTLLSTRGTAAQQQQQQQQQCADSLTVLDGRTGSDRPVLFRFCASGTETSSHRGAEWRAASDLPGPIVSSSSSVELVLSSRPESSVPLLRHAKQKRGFFVTYAAEPQAPGCGGLYTARSAVIKSADYEPSLALSGAGASSASSEELALAYEYARYFEQQRQQAATSTQASNAVVDYLLVGSRANNSATNRSSATSMWRPNKGLRCEYEIRPGDRARNHQIELNWLEMPSEIVNREPGSSLGRLLRRERCARARLTLFDRQDSSVPLATFCSGDRYNSSSLAQLATGPIVSGGHALFLVYETAALSEAAENGQQQQQQDESATGANKRAGGFRLHYSTRCSAVYRQLESQIITELDVANSVRECLYHLELPENNTISMLIEPLGFVAGDTPTALIGSDQQQQQRLLPLTIADGSCAVQAIFVDGAKPRGRLELARMERQLRAFEFRSADSSNTPIDTFVNDGEQTNKSDNFRQSTTEQVQTNRLAENGTQVNGASVYWQYTESNQAHDIKQFDVCHWPGLTLDSMWNHMSLMFRLNPALDSNGQQQQVDVSPGHLQVRIRYRAQRACGGIVTARSGRIELVGSRQLAQQQFTASTGPRNTVLGEQRNSCAWILRNIIPNQLIQFHFEQVPTAEIERRLSSWIEWMRERRRESERQTKKSRITQNELPGNTIDPEPSAQSLTSSNCSQAFEEIIELYEPSINMSRLLCPNQLVLGANDLSIGSLHWTSQTDTVFIRLLSSSSSSSQQNSNTSKSNLSWPGKKALFAQSTTTTSKIKPMLLYYNMLNPTTLGRSCGGKLVQSSGIIETPRHPLNYPSSSDCVWLIQAPDAQQQIRMNFTRFEMEPQTICWFDYLEIRNGPSKTSPLVGRFCNNELESRVIVSHSSSVWLHFRSDAHISRPGFRLYFDAAQTGCGGHLSAPSGEIESPNYPHAYTHAADCEWTIEVAQGNRLVLSVSALDLIGSQQQTGNSNSCKTEGADAEYLEVFDLASAGGLGSDDERQPRSLSGRLCQIEQSNATAKTVNNGKKLEFKSTSNAMRLVYKSQAQLNGRGFSLSYKTDCQLDENAQEIDALSGAIESPGYPSAYLPGLECSWLVRGPLGSRLLFTLADMQLEGFADMRRAAQQPIADDLFNGATGLRPLVTSGTNSANNSNVARKSTCTGDQVRLWSVRVGVAKNYNSNASVQFFNSSSALRNIQLASNYGQLNDRLVTLDKQVRLNSIISGQNVSLEFKLERIFCGSAELTGRDLANQFTKAERSFEIASNRALIQFWSDRSVEMRGFRLEWRARVACGFQRRGSDTFVPIIFDERLNLTSISSDDDAEGPLECLWTVDMSRLGHALELELSSDMRAPSITTMQQSDNDQKACQQASLTVYDGLSALNSPVIAQNCQSRRKYETLFASSGTVLIRFYLSSARKINRFGRNFAIYGWPKPRDGCSQSIFDISNPFMRAPIIRYSPNYPDLYDSKPYRCTSLLASNNAGRLRFTIDELDIPNETAEMAELTGTPLQDYSVNVPQNGQLFIGPTCSKQSNNFLRIKSVNLYNQVSEFVCGTKFDRSLLSNSDEQRQRAVIVSEQPSTWLDFYSSGQARGKWRVSVDRLCGSSVSNIMTDQEFSTPDYPRRPDWPENSLNTNSANERVCAWRLSTQNAWSSQKQSQDKLYFSLTQFIPTDTNNTSLASNECLRVYEGVNLSLRTSVFNLTDLDARFEPKLKLCKHSDLVHSTLSYASRGSELVVLVSGRTIAQFRVRPYDNHCGGDYQFEQAQFASPNYPQAYPTDLDCHHFVLGSPGSRIQLKFLQFDLPEPEFVDYKLNDNDDENDGIQNQAQTKSNAMNKACDNVDHIEIRQLSTRKRVDVKLKSMLLGWWSNQAGRNLRWTLTKNKLLLDDSLEQGNITQKFNNKLSQDNARILDKLRNETHSFVERLYDLSKLYMLTDDTAHTELSVSSRVRTRLRRLNIKLEDFYAQSKLIGRFCGKRAPKLAPDELRDEILVRFRTFSSLARSQSKNARGFLAQYNIEYGGFVRVDPSEQVQPESSTDDDSSLLARGCGLLASPQFPNVIKYNQTVSWTFEATKPGYVIEFDLVSMQLGGPLSASTNSASCTGRDSLSIFDGPTTSDLRLARLCGHLSLRNLLDKSMLPAWARAYKGQLSPNRLVAHSSSVLMRRVRSSTQVTHLVYDNLLAPGSFVLHYCAVRASNESSSSDIHLSDFDDEASRPLDAAELEQIEQSELLGRAANFGGPSGSCSRSVLLTPGWLSGANNNSSQDQVELSSPNWPQEVNERDIECQWHVYTHDNTNIRLAIDPSSSSLAANLQAASTDQADTADRFAVSDCFESRGQRRSFVVVHDGASQLAPVLARYCLPAPPGELRSTGRNMLVRYVHSNGEQASSNSASVPLRSTTTTTTSSLFRAHARVAQCGGQYFVDRTIQLRDRSSQQSRTYKNNLDCVYQLFASSLDHVIAIHLGLSEIQLSPEPSNPDCTVGDYIELRDLPLIVRHQQALSGGTGSTSNGAPSWRTSRVSGRLLGRFCPGKKIEHSWRVESPGPGLEIRFHTDKSNVSRGWELFVASSEPRLSCPQMTNAIRLDEPFGFITSPNWPDGFTGKRLCKYHLIAPFGKQIELRFVRMRRPLSSSATGSQCLDSINYLADNEAGAMRYDSRPLRELTSPASGQQLRRLVQEITCRESQRHFAMFNALHQTTPNDSASLVALLGLNTTSKAFGSLSADQYIRLTETGPRTPLQIVTLSRVLLLEYASDNLGPGDGFLALYKLVELEDKCGGIVSVHPGNNVLESARFNQPMNESEPHIQCEWAFKFDQPNYGGLQMDGSASSLFLSDTTDQEMLPGTAQNRSWAIIPPTVEHGDEFVTNYLVFEVLEIPPQIENASVFEQDWSMQAHTQSGGESSPENVCGLNRMLLADFFSSHALIACGYLTHIAQRHTHKWTLVDEFSGNLLVRTRNLRRVLYNDQKIDLTSQEQQQRNSGNLIDVSQAKVGQSQLFRGIRAHFYESRCPSLERLPGALLIRSHLGYSARNNSNSTSNYKPGICRWIIKLRPGKFEINFFGLNLRNRTDTGQSGDSNCQSVSINPKLDYIELSSGASSSGSSLLARICANNQAKLMTGSHQLPVMVSRELQVLFIAGLDRLANGKQEFEPSDKTLQQGQFGFELQIKRLTSNSEHEFCHANPRAPSVYNFIRNRDANSMLNDFMPNGQQMTSQFLYPKNVHCQLDLSLEDEEQRFNLSFVNMFDLEQSRNCSADYVEISDLIELSLSEWAEKYMDGWGNVTNSTVKPKKIAKGQTERLRSMTTARPPQFLEEGGNQADQANLFSGYKETLVPRKIGRWCGKQLPRNKILSKSSRIRIVFHTNSFIEGKGFILEYSAFTPQQTDDGSNSTERAVTRRVWL